MADPSVTVYVRRLTDVPDQHLPWHRARLKFIARFTNALLQLTTTNLAKLALALKATVQPASNYRRIQRFMADFSFDYDVFGRFLLGLLPQESDFVVCIDRTEWHFGSQPVNVLMIGVAYQGIAFPVVWEVLSKEGSSSVEEGVALFRRLVRLARPEDIRVVTADREFIGEDWLAFLAEREISFAIRLRKRRRLALGAPDGPALPAEMFFRALAPGGVRLLERLYLGEVAANIVGKRLTEDEYVILATPASPDEIAPDEALQLYRRRWEIETLFAALKSRGFDLETTHLARPERISKLIGLLSLAFVWSHLIGQWRAESEGGPMVKSHGYPAKSLFRYGLDYLQTTLLSLPQRQQAFQRCINILAHPSQFLSCS
jgi:hypothetical protein